MKKKYNLSEEERTALEDEFQALVDFQGKELQDKLEELYKLEAKLLGEATDLSEKYGIPFYHGNQSYFPKSFDKKYEAIMDCVSDLTSAWDHHQGEIEYGEWMPSQLCYY